jgi:hypothetical protein
MQRVDMNSEIDPPHSIPWSSYHEHQLVTPKTAQGNTAQMFPSNPSGIETHHHFPRGCPPQTNGQHFVPTPDFSDQQRNIHQTSGHYAPNHKERQHGPTFQNRVWNRPESQNISGRGDLNTHLRVSRTDVATEAEGKEGRAIPFIPPPPSTEYNESEILIML